MQRFFLILSLALNVTNLAYGDLEQWLRPFESIDREIEATRSELETLADVTTFYTENYVGYRSHRRDQPVPEKPIQIQIDLQAPHPVDSIVLTPSQFYDGARSLSSYGFPRRFVVEGSLQPDFREPVRFFEALDADFPAPGLLPVYISAAKQKARFIRLSIHRLSEHRGSYVGSIGEIAVFSEGENVALFKPVETSNSANFEGIFKPEYAVDGFTPLGLPERERAIVHRGWHARVESGAECRKFIRFVFPAPASVDTVILYPARGLESYTIPDYGFPANFSITGIDEEEKSVEVADYSKSPFLTPRANPVVFKFARSRLKEVRIDVTRLRVQFPRMYVLAFAEVEILDGLKNVAPQAEVLVSDNHNRPQWSISSVVDGNSSSGELIPTEQWYWELSLRRELTQRIERLKAKRFARAQMVELTLRGTLLVVLALMGLVFYIQIRSRIERYQRLASIRQQIASDLHDDIGSNLASLLLMGEALNRKGVEPARQERVRAEIVSVVKETQHAMDDIVWMLHPDRKGTNLIWKLEEIARRMLPGKSLEMTLCPPDQVEDASKRQKRELILFYKECLHNILKHTDAEIVRIGLNIEGKKLRLSITDDATTGNESRPVNLNERTEKMSGYLETNRVGSMNHLDLIIPLL